MLTNIVCFTVSPSTLTSAVSPSTPTSAVSPTTSTSAVSPSTLTSAVSPSTPTSAVSPSTSISVVSPSTLTTGVRQLLSYFGKMMFLRPSTKDPTPTTIESETSLNSTSKLLQIYCRQIQLYIADYTSITAAHLCVKKIKISNHDMSVMKLRDNPFTTFMVMTD